MVADKELDRALLRALAFEQTVRDTGLRPRAHVLPGVPAALALRATEDAGPDCFSMRVGSPAATLTRGLGPEVLFRQLLGRASAESQGRDAGSFPTNHDLGLLAPVSLPGKGTEVMSGVALALRMRGEDRVAIYVDDVAGTASGDWHEGFNFAAVRRAPLVVVMDSTGPMHPHSALDRLTRKSAAYGVESWSTSVASPSGILRAVSEAVSRARAGEGVGLVEVLPDPSVSGPQAPSFTEGVIGRLEDGPSIFEAFLAEMSTALELVRAEPEPGADAAYAGMAPTPWYRTPTLRTAAE